MRVIETVLCAVTDVITLLCTEKGVYELEVNLYTHCSMGASYALIL